MKPSIKPIRSISTSVTASPAKTPPIVSADVNHSGVMSSIVRGNGRFAFDFIRRSRIDFDLLLPMKFWACGYL
jgi:hypothetical protein